MTPFRLAVLNLCRRPLPSLIALLAIAISVACSGVLLRLNLLSQERFSTLGRGGDALVGAKAGGIEMLLSALNGEGTYPGFLPYKLFETLQAETTVHFEDGAQAQPTYLRSIIPFVYFAQVAGHRVVGTNADFIHRPEPDDSLRFQSGAWSEAPGELVVGSAASENLHLHEGDVVSARIWSEGRAAGERSVNLKVVGVLEPTRTAWDSMLFTNLPTAQRSLAGQDLSQSSIWGAGVLNYFLVYLKPDGFKPLATLINRRTVAEAVRIDEQKERLRELTGTGERLGFFITILVLTLGGLSVTSMLITRFEAMSLQLACLRAIGHSKNMIARWLLWEGFLLGLAATLLGLCLDGILFPLIRSLLGAALPPPELVSSQLWLSYPVWLTALVATTASVFIPLYRVYQQDVHFSLRA